MSVADFRKLCEDYAWQQIERQREQFKRLGVRGDWENPYVTLQPEFEAQQIRVFGEMAKRGYIYKGLKPVNWSPSSESALAEAEIEYQDKRSASIYVAFKVKDGKGVLENGESFIIWTTTPWTMPANLGISVHPDLEYNVIKVGDKRYVVAAELIENVAEACGFENPEVVASYKGRELEYITAEHPLYGRDSLVMLGDHVTTDAGTGCVHTAPGHGEDDFIVGQKYGLEVLCPVDEKGNMTDEAPGFEGMFYDKANKPITEKLEENGALLKLEFITHSYPHDWRTKKPTIFRATAQWFASIKDFRSDLLDAIKQTKWVPEWGEQRLYNMVRDRGDWCISRQRVWGFRSRYFMQKTVSRSSLTKRLNTCLSCSNSTAQTYGLKERQKTSCRKDLHIREARTESSRKSKTLWMYGLIQVLPIRPFLKNEMILSVRLIYTLKALTNTAAGLTHLFPLLLQSPAKRRIKAY